MLSAEGLQQALSHVLWIGGSTDAGKTTVSQIIARRNGFQVYHYDEHSFLHFERKAKTIPEYRAQLEATMDERWVYPNPEQLLNFVLKSFQDSFAMVIEDLLSLSRDKMIVAEGFGLTPALVAEVMTNWHQGIWLVSTEGFKKVSMRRRSKPSFRDKTSDPVRATRNLFERDMLLAERVKNQAQVLDLKVHEIDGKESAAEVANMVEQHFVPLMRFKVK